MNLKELIKKGESEKVEFKKSLRLKDEIGETVSAFSNFREGKIIVGVDDKNKEVIGVEIGKNTMEDLANYIKQHTGAQVFPGISVESIGDKEVIVIEVPELPEKPVLFKGRPYKRVGKSTHKASAGEVRKLVVDSKKIYWDERVCEGATPDDIDEMKVKQFLRKAKRERNFDVESDTPVREVLERLNLLKHGGITNAAVLLFAREPAKFFIQAKIRCARFKGTDTLDYIDMKVFESTLPELRENAMKFIMQHIKHAVFFDENRRHDRWEYPLRALEEVLSNALAHRDYDSPAQIQLSVFDDRVEVWNPGELPPPLTLEDLKRKHRSIPRNPLIAELLFLIKYIEQWGKGTNRVIKRLEESNLTEPLFQNLSGGFEVIVYGPGREFEEMIEKEKFHTLNINDRQKKAVIHVKKKGNITKREYMEKNKVSDKTAYLELNDLLLKGIFSRRGVGRATKYIMK